MAVFMTVLMWFIAILGALFGGAVVVAEVWGATGPPQQAAAATIGLALAVIPYCIARAASELLSLSS